MINVPIIKQFEDIAEKYPNNVALKTEHESINYDKLNQMANQLALYMQLNGLTYHNAIGICLPVSIDMVAAVLAIQKLGIPYVPIDDTYPTNRIKYMIQDAGISSLLTHRKIANKVGDIGINTLCLEQFQYNNDRLDNLHYTENDIVYILYTSGSTGVPKGVEIFQKGLTNYLNYCCDSYLTRDSQLSNPASFAHLPLAFDASVTSLFSPLMVGRSLIIPSKQGLEVFNDPLVQNSEFDFVKLTPAHLLLLKEQMEKELLNKWTKYLIVGGEALTPGHLSYYKKLNLDWTVVNEYGPTETVVGSTTHFFSLNEPIPNKIPIGKPIYNTSIYIMDKEMNEVSTGNIGEIVIGGVGVAKGYHNNEQLTIEKFIDDFITPGNRVYRTGDLGIYQNNGEIVYCGRIDDQVKIRGYRIEISDIEVGLKKIPDVNEAAVIVKQDNMNIKSLEAFFVANRDMDVNEVISELSQHIPAYMLPSRITQIKEMPITSNGKINRKILETLESISHKNIEKLSALEVRLLPLWQEVLNIQNFKSTDKFSCLGGHSLLAVMLISKIYNEFSIKLPILSLYPNGTLQDVAGQLEELINAKEAI